MKNLLQGIDKITSLWDKNIHLVKFITVSNTTFLLQMSPGILRQNDLSFFNIGHFSSKHRTNLAFLYLVLVLNVYTFSHAVLLMLHSIGSMHANPLDFCVNALKHLSKLQFFFFFNYAFQFVYKVIGFNVASHGLSFGYLSSISSLLHHLLPSLLNQRNISLEWEQFIQKHWGINGADKKC